MATTIVSRTQSGSESAAGRRTFTFSAWIKRTGLGSCELFGSDSNGARGNNYFIIDFNGSNNLDISEYISGSQLRLITNRVFRDTSAWYHLVLAFDTTQGTSSNRIKVYINGVQETSFSTATYPSQDYQTKMFAQNKIHAFGRSGGQFDGLISHCHATEGTAYTPSAFGETDSTTGEWKIKTDVSVSYGTNGFFLFKDDNAVTNQAGNSSGNFAVTAGTLTKTEDNPSNVFATLNPLHTTGITGNYFLSNGNLKQTVGNNDGHRQTGFTLHPKGLKGYFEVKCTVDPNFHLGLQNAASKLGQTNYYTLASPNYYYMQASNPVKISYANGGSAATHIADYFSQISVGDIIGCAFDFTGTNKNVWFHKNGTYGNNGSGVGNPATGAYPAMTSTQLTADEYEFIVSPNTGSGDGQLDFNFGNGYFATTAVSSAGTNASNNGIFEYDVPAGYTALSTKGLNT